MAMRSAEPFIGCKLIGIQRDSSENGNEVSPKAFSQFYIRIKDGN